MDTYKDFQVGTLVESYAYSFGRVVDRAFNVIGIKFSYTAPVIYYSLEQAKKYLKVHEE